MHLNSELKTFNTSAEMFYLSELEHSLRVPPHLLNLPLEDAIKSVLQNVFLDKVCLLPLCYSFMLSIACPAYRHTG